MKSAKFMPTPRKRGYEALTALQDWCWKSVDTGGIAKQAAVITGLHSSILSGPEIPTVATFRISSANGRC